jgi:hypothetical protein
MSPKSSAHNIFGSSTQKLRGKRLNGCKTGGEGFRMRPLSSSLYLPRLRRRPNTKQFPCK